MPLSRSIPAASLAIALVAALAMPASAQWKRLSIKGLEQTDIDMMRAAGRAVGEEEVGAETSWKNSATQNDGRAKLVERDEQDGMPCRIIAHRVHIGQTDETVDLSFRTCRKDGKWLLAPKE